MTSTRRQILARSIVADRSIEWNSPGGPLMVTIKRIHKKSARILLPGGVEKVVPVSELNLTGRWKSGFKTARKDAIPGGKGDSLDTSDVDSDQLQMGIKVEMEHTDDSAVAEEIALDHLKEDPKYYTKLKKVHRESRRAGLSSSQDAIRKALDVILIPHRVEAHLIPPDHGDRDFPAGTYHVNLTKNGEEIDVYNDPDLERSMPQIRKEVESAMHAHGYNVSGKEIHTGLFDITPIAS